MDALVIGMYLVVAVLAGLKTYFEQQDKRIRSLLARTLGFVACAVWPVTVAATAAAVFFYRRDA